MKKICLIGTGGFAKEVVWLIDDLGRFNDIECFMEPDDIWTDRKIMDIPVRPQSEFDPGLFTAVIAIGNPTIREKVDQQMPVGTEYETLVHPRSYATRWAKLGEGSIVCAGSIVSVHAEIGRHTQINCHTAVGHDTIIGDFCTTTTCVGISGDCVIGNHVYWGHNSNIRQGLKVCDNVMIGMGAVVAKDITEPGVYVGMPVKKIK